ncbi:hypothetical protein KDL29_07110 [bacterium]|nr:hypothetical protein [bacterium]
MLSIDLHELDTPEVWDFYYIPEQFRELPFTPASGSYLYLRPYLGEELGPVCEFVQVPLEVSSGQ